MIIPIQLAGPFSAGDNILKDYCQDKYNQPIITHLAIFAPYNHTFTINDTEIITMNKMKILDYEIEDNTFFSLRFNQNEDSNTLVTFDLEIAKKEVLKNETDN